MVAQAMPLIMSINGVRDVDEDIGCVRELQRTEHRQTSVATPTALSTLPGSETNGTRGGATKPSIVLG